MDDLEAASAIAVRRIVMKIFMLQLVWDVKSMVGELKIRIMRGLKEKECGNHFDGEARRW